MRRDAIKVLGVDPGLKNTGYGILEKKGSRMAYLGSGVIRTSPQKNFPKRLVKIQKELSQVIDKWHPDMMSIEEAIYAQNVRIAIKLGHARAAAILAAADAGLEIFEYAPKKIKSSVTGNGRAKKEQLRYMVKNILKTDNLSKSLDESDALGAAICHINQFQFTRRI